MIKKEYPPYDLLLRLISSIILFLFSIQVLTILMSLLKLRIDNWTARGILTVALTIVLLSLLVDIDLLNSPALKNRIHRWRVPFLVFLGVSLTTYLVLLVNAYVVPDFSWDGIAYHIPTIAMWDEQGYISWVKTSYLESLINGYPKGAELVAYILVKAFNHSVINTINLVFLPLGVFGIAYLARSLGAGRMLAICAGAAFILLPVNINQSDTTYVDSAYASCVIGVIASLIALVNSKSALWKRGFIFGAALSLALSTKSTGVMLSGIALLFLIGVWTRDFIVDYQPLKKWPHQQTRNMIQRLSLLIGIVIIAFVGGGFWYIRNYLFTGSPMYPVGLSLFGHTFFPGKLISASIGENANTPEQLKNLSKLARVFFTWTQGIKLWPYSILTYDSRLGSLGYLWVFACLPSVIVSLLSFKKHSFVQKQNLLILVGVVGLAFLFTPMNWWARYTAWIYVLGLPCFAFVLTNTVFNQKACTWTRCFSSVWMTFCLSVLLFESIICVSYVTMDGIQTSLKNGKSISFESENWGWPTIYLYPDVQGTPIEDMLTYTGSIGVGPIGDLDPEYYGFIVGQLFQPIGARHLIFLEQAPNMDQISKLKDIKYIIWDQSVFLPSIYKNNAVSITQTGGFQVIQLQE